MPRPTGHGFVRSDQQQCEQHRQQSKEENAERIHGLRPQAADTAD
jgi:hypothetical protein